MPNETPDRAEREMAAIEDRNKYWRRQDAALYRLRAVILLTRRIERAAECGEYSTARALHARLGKVLGGPA